MVAFGYADGCKKSGKGFRGGTSANLQVLTDPVWAPNVAARMQAIAQDLVPLQEALPGTPWPAVNALRAPLPNLSIHYKVYNDTYRTACEYQPGEPDTICPGIPAEFAPLLENAGFLKAVDASGYTRYLLDSTIIANRVGMWWDSPVANSGKYGNFYGRDWGTDLLDNHSNGRVMRIVLNPIDLSLACQGVGVKAGADAVGNVRFSINQPRAIATHVGWRLAGTSEWQEGAVVPAASLGASAALDLSIPLPGVKGGQQVEFMVNYDRKVAEMSDSPTASAYTNNSCTSAVAEARPNLEIYDIWYSPGKPNPGDPVLVTVTVKNSSAAAYGPLTVTSLRWTVGGQTYNAKQNWTLAPGEEHRFELGTFTAKGSGSMTVTAEVNPDHDQPPVETTWSDNRTSIAVPVAGGPVDLSVSLSAPAAAACDMSAKIPLQWTYHNAGTETYTGVPYSLTVTAGGRTQTLTSGKINRAPGDTTRSLSVPPLGCGTDMTSVITLNLPVPGAVPETDYSNNSATAVTAVDPQTPVGGSGGGGSA